MKTIIIIAISKLAGFLINIINKKRGTILAGLVALKLDSNIVSKFKNIDPDKVIMITGTNGKSTTTNLMAHTLITSEKDTATNFGGANMMSGVVTTLIKNSTITGKFKREYLVLEIDERSLPAIHKLLPAKHLCITNLQKDQAQRNGDPDFIYSKFEKVINKDMTVYLNNEEPRSKGLEDRAGQAIYYSVEKNEKSFEKQGFYVVTLPCPKCNHKIEYSYFNLESIGAFKCSNCNHSSEENVDVVISNIDFENNNITEKDARYKINYTYPFYIYNYAASIAIGRNLGLTNENLEKAFESFINPHERREILEYKDKKIKYLRMKQENPETLQSALDIIARDKSNKAVLIGLYEIKDFLPYYTNTFYFFDCDFGKIAETEVEKYIVFSRTVSYDTANRMIYDGVDREKIVVLDEEENMGNIMSKLDDVETDNIYMITGMKPYGKIKEYLEKEKTLAVKRNSN